LKKLGFFIGVQQCRVGKAERSTYQQKMVGFHSARE